MTDCDCPTCTDEEVEYEMDLLTLYLAGRLEDGARAEILNHVLANTVIRSTDATHKPSYEVQ